jgi:hypothetical protein
VSGNRPEWGTFEHYFRDLWFNRMESRITDFTGRKTGLFKPVWLPDRFLDGLEYG